MVITTTLSQFTTLAAEVSNHPIILYSMNASEPTLVGDFMAIVDQRMGGASLNWAAESRPSVASFTAIYPNAIAVTNIAQ